MLQESCETLQNGGKQVLEDYLGKQEQLVYCIMELFDIEELQN